MKKEWLKNVNLIATLIFYLTFLFCEITYKILIFGWSNIWQIQTLNLLLSLLPLSILLSLLTHLFSEKKNRIHTVTILFLIGVWYSLEFVFKKIFNTFFCLVLFGLSDQALAFTGTAIIETLKNSYGILLFFIPYIIIMFFRHRLYLEQFSKKTIIHSLIAIILSCFIFTISLNTNRDFTNSAYELYYATENDSLNTEKLGIVLSTYLDFKRTFLKHNPEVTIDIDQTNEPETTTDYSTEPTYSLNTTDIDFNALAANETNSTLKSMNTYFANDSGTYHNEYTGYYKDKNLIVIMGESFNTIAIDSELTPTLYKMANSSFVFNNFYTPINLSTIGGEFQDLTSLFANLSDLNNYWRKGTNTYPYGLGTVFNNLNYTTHAYHANYGNFQDRNVYLKSMGFNDFLYRGNGLEKRMNCNIWPQSDLDLVDATYTDWINEDHFLTYYVSVSGHMPYTLSGNAMSKKNKDLVANLNLSNDAKYYLAANIELDRAVASLISNLEAAGKLDDTVIAIIPDHYPYSLDLDTINELSKYTRDDTIEINHSSLILWNNKTPTINIDKVASQIDFIPTLYNLFGIKYDSRLFMGKDILSSESGLAFFNNRSWITAEGRYYASSNTFVPNEGKTIPDNYLSSINKTVSNRINMSKLIIEENYYDYLGINKNNQ